MLFIICVCVWGFIVGITPFGIWAIKSRLSYIEDRLRQLELTHNLADPCPQQAHEQMTASAKEQLTPAPTPKPAQQVSTPIEFIRSPIIPTAPQKAAESVSSMQTFMQAEASISAPTPTEKPAETKPPLSEMPPRFQEEYPQGYVSRPLEFTMPSWLTRSLTGGRLFVTLGLVLLFMGSAMLFKYMSNYITIPIEARFLGVALGAFGLIGFGSRQAGKRRDFGLYLQGGGLGLLFLTVFCAFKFYSLISPTVALVMLVAIGSATFGLSILADSMALSVLAVTGGFLAPILASNGGGSHIALFSYYLVINLVIFAIAWKKSWRVLNTIGFVFTFAISALWANNYYMPQFYTSVQGFLIAYYLLYTGIGLLYASKSEPRFTYPIDFASIFGVPLIGCGLQFTLVQHIENGAALSCALLGLFYTGLFLMLGKSQNTGLKMLSQPFIWLAGLFYTMAIPFALSSHTTAMLWAMEGAAMLSMAERMKNTFYTFAGIAVLLASNLFMLPVLHMQGSGTPFMNTFYLSAVVMAVAHILSAHFLCRQKVIDRYNIAVFSLLGMGWWFGAGLAEVMAWPVLGSIFIMPCLGFYVLSSLAFLLLSNYSEAPLLSKPISYTLAAIVIASVSQLVGAGPNYHPAMHYGWLALPLAFAVHYIRLWKQDLQAPQFHVPAYVTLVLLLGFELGYHLYSVEMLDVQRVAGWMIAASAGVLLLTLPVEIPFWPLAVMRKFFRMEAGMPLIFWAVALCFYSFTQAVMPYAHRYVPFVNAVEVAELATLMALLSFYLQAGKEALYRNHLAALFTLVIFGFVNSLMLRILSDHLEITYFSEAMWDSAVVMTALTILWTLMSMAAMILSSRLKTREGWMAGAALLGVVIVKLFAVDLANIGTLSRIISFMGVGMLSLLLGYISPMPAKKKV